MRAARDRPQGWKPIPLPLKILAVMLVLWLLGALANLPNLLENGLPLLGFFCVRRDSSGGCVDLRHHRPACVFVCALDPQKLGRDLGLCLYGIFHRQ
jgi:hypothetical protein